jgi:hypothetical protein
MKVVNWNQYWMRRQAQRNGAPVMSLGRAAPAAAHSSSGTPSSGTHVSDRIRMDCLQRYVKAQLLPRSTK